jgi:predicted lysophospholipase L1 biosynthesis ABC-type transport system permease subunit
MPADVADRGVQVGLFGADPSLFEVLHMRVVDGRSFAAGDDDRGAPVAIMSLSLAERLGDVHQAVGTEVRVGNETLRIVGVVNSARFGGPFEDETQRYELYRPLAQMPRNVVSLFAEVPGEPGAHAPQLARLIAQIAPTAAVDWVGPVDYWIREQLGGMRFVAVLFTLFGWACLVLAGLGILGITAAGVASRARELAIRQALGATPASLQMAFTRRAMRLAIAGAIIGAGGQAVLVRIVSSVGGDLRVSDPTELTIAALVLVAATAAAAWLPARRVTTIQPAAALRE